MMQIWVDADACPKIIKEILFRAANRTSIRTIFVANQPMTTPPSPYIKKLVVGAGFDIADKRIVNDMSPGDLVITADIPLADAVVEKGGIALNPRGELYTVDNIKHRLAMRNLMSGLRDGGVITGGPEKLSQKASMEFAKQLDRLLAKAITRS
jgi:uncharacterized protein YaiI (UPF0178 family)